VRALLIYPRFNPNSFWNYHETCALVGARYPAAPLGLITVAALLPSSWEIKLINCNTRQLSDGDLDWADVVLTGGMLPQQRDTLRIMARSQARGKPVVVGGPDASSSPEVYAAADFRVVGEAEEIISELIDDLSAGRDGGTYTSRGFVDVTRSPVPRFDLLRLDDYLHVGVQYSRGCPFNCEFCDIIELYGRVPRVKSAEQMLRELDALYATGYRGHVDFVDDNLIGNKKTLKAFLPQLKTWLEARGQPFEFTTEATINLADNAELLGMMRDTNFFAIFVGIESPDGDTLVHMQKKQNTRRVLADSVHTLYEAGIWVNAGFIVGFDTEKGAVASEMIRCIEDTDIPVCMVGLLYALPNTQLTRRLQTEGRLHPGHDVLTDDEQIDQCTSGLNFDTVRPRQDVLTDYREVLDRVYTPAAYFGRVRRVARRLDCSHHRHRPPLRNILRDLRTFGRILLHMGIRDRTVRGELWRTVIDCVLHNPRALKQVVVLIALYRHMGPFAAYVSGQLDGKITELQRATTECGTTGGPWPGIVAAAAPRME